MTQRNAIENSAQKTALRDAFGAFATGVTVVTMRDAQGNPMGFTANSFTSVSLDPALLLICLGRSSSKLREFSQTNRFAVNVLAANQTHISRRFAASHDDRFTGVEWHLQDGGAPLIAGASAWFDCTCVSVQDAGDHIILLGQIVAYERSAHAPLIYLQGRYLQAPSDLSVDQTGFVTTAQAVFEHEDRPQ